MLQSGYMLREFHHIFAAASRLARLLHCASESVACPMCISAVGDSRSRGTLPRLEPGQRAQRLQLTMGRLTHVQ